MPDVTPLIEHLFRHESGRLTATLLRSFGMARLDLVEDVVQDALVAALRHWRLRGVPERPVAWLTEVARRKAIDRLRGDARWRVRLDLSAADSATAPDRGRGEGGGASVGAMDEQLQLVFACAHPRLDAEDRIALTLRLVGGFGPAEIARALLTSSQAIAQRLVRAKRRLRDDAIVLEVPDDDRLHERLDAVLETLYLLFNEGHSAHGGDALIRRELVDEALRLVDLLLRDARTADGATHALMALMLFQAARLDARTDLDDTLVPMDEQDRSRWDGAMIQRGFHHLRHSMGDRLTAFHLEAAIASCHVRAPDSDATRWREIVELYDLLLRIKPTPVVALNRAVAVAMADGPQAGLAAIDAIAPDRRLARYHLLPAARGEILRRAGRHDEAAIAFAAALEHVVSGPERRLLERRLAAVVGRSPNRSS